MLTDPLPTTELRLIPTKQAEKFLFWENKNLNKLIQKYWTFEREYLIESNVCLSQSPILKSYSGCLKMVEHSLCVKDYSEHIT